MFSVLWISVAAETSAQTFEDVPTSVEYYEAVEMLVEKGAVSKAKKFNPSNDITRGQLAKILAISLDLNTKTVKNPKFKDVPTTHQKATKFHLNIIFMRMM
ncbi:MAG: S-layer homology domain-containing protein [Lysinibacillus sp.]